MDGPGKKPGRAWAKLPDDWERVPSGEVSFFMDHSTGELHEQSPLEGQPPVPVEKRITAQRVLPPRWSKKWDSLGCAMVAYGVEETKEEAKARVSREQLKKDLSKLPSWVPVWAFPTPWDPEPLVDWARPKHHYWASGSTVPYLHSAPDSFLLSLDGHVVDEILQIAPAWHPETNSPPISRKGIDALIAWEALGISEVDNCPYRSTGGRANALWRTMIADYAGNGAAPSEDWACIEAWYDRIGWAKDIPESQGMGPWDKATAESDYRGVETRMFEHFFKLRPPLAASTVGFRETLKAAAAEPPKIKKAYGAYIRRIHGACAHRALFVTRKGYIGLGPWNAREGDQVAILYGGQTPYLLRKSAVTGYNTLVGEAYVYGIMAGEALIGEFAESGPQQLHIA